MAAKPKARSGYATYLQAGLPANQNTGTGQAFTTLAQVKSLKGPAGAVTSADVTNMDSPAVAGGVIPASEHIPLILSTGDVTVEGNYIDDVTQQNFITLFSAGSVVDWCMSIPTTGTNRSAFYFTAFIDKLETEFAVNAEQKFTAGLKITGVATYPS